MVVNIDHIGKKVEWILKHFTRVNFQKKFFSIFKGEQLMDYLASPEAMELPDQIEEVNAKQLDTLVQEKMFVAVLFCK